MREYFPGLFGNGEARARIGRAIDGGNVPHAFLIEGARGSGRSTFATMIAMALNCEERGGGGGMLASLGIGGDRLPCGVCNSCRRIREGNFTDVRVLARRAERATIGVDDVRDIREDMFLSATESAHKVYIIKDAECLTTEAQNALLTVLEEPPAGVVIILVATGSDRILTTVKSRVQTVATSRFENAELEKYLLKLSDGAAVLRRESPEKFRAVIMSAEGVLGRAIELSDPRRAAECEDERRECTDLIDAISPRAGYSTVYRVLSRLPQKRVELAESLERVMLALRDLVAVKSDASVGTLFYSSRAKAEAAGAESSLVRVLSVYDAVLEAHELILKNANVANVLANLASRITLI